MKSMNPTEIAVKEARQNELFRVLLLAKEAENLPAFIESLEQLINQG